MAAKGHPWLFLRYTVLSVRMVRRPLEFLQRPMRFGDPASYTSVLYIMVPPLSAHPATQVVAQVTGITPLHHIAVLQLVTGATVVGIPAVDVIHPAGEASHVELIEVVDTFHICAVVHGRPVGLHVNSVVTAYALEYIEYALALAELHLRGGKNNAVLRHEGLLVLYTLVHVVQNGLAGDGERAGVRYGGIHRRILRLYRIGLALRDRLGHVLVLIAGILRLHRLCLAAGGAEQQQEYCQKQGNDMSALRSHVTAPS